MVTRSASNDAFVSNTAYDVSRNYAVNGLNQYTAAGPANFTCDAAGHRTSLRKRDGTTIRQCDAINRLL